MRTNSHISTFESIYNSLGFSIVSGKFGPSGLMPTEAELAKSFEASRNAVREAVKTLIGKGMLETKTRTGIHILPEEHWNSLDEDLLRWRRQYIGPKNFLREIYDLRLMLEPEAHALAAARITNEDIVKLKQVFALMRKADTEKKLNEFSAADQKFHAIIFGAIRNPIANQLSSMIGMAIDVGWVTSAYDLPWYTDEHEAIMNAIVEHDPERARKETHNFLTLLMKDVGIDLL